MSLDSSATVRDLLSEDRCSPSCLLAQREEAGKCACRCAGEFHALLADAPLSPIGVPPAGAQITTLRKGDVVALGLTTGACPVGLVEAVDHLGVRLLLMSFLTGYFGDAIRFVPWRQIEEIRHASEEEDDDEAAAARAIGGNSRAKVYDTKPLGAFQTLWFHKRPWRECALCSRRIYGDDMFFFLADQGAACGTCIERKDLYDRVVSPPRP